MTLEKQVINSGGRSLTWSITISLLETHAETFNHLAIHLSVSEILQSVDKDANKFRDYSLEFSSSSDGFPMAVQGLGTSAIHNNRPHIITPASRHMFPAARKDFIMHPTILPIRS
jgi:hypothetical protein